MAVLLIWGLYVASIIWVGFDAKKHDWSNNFGAKSAGGYILAVVVFWIIFFPLYLVQRRKAPLLVDPAPQAIIAEPTPTPALGSGFKTCPDCAETVRADARVCKHCRYRFDTAPVPADEA